MALRQVSLRDVLPCSHLLHRWKPFISVTPWFSNITAADSSVWPCSSVHTVSLCSYICVGVYHRGWQVDRYLQNVGRVHQPLILCNCNLFEQPAVSHRQSYVRAETRPNSLRERQMGRETDRAGEREREIGLHLSKLICLNATIRQTFLDTSVFPDVCACREKRECVRVCWCVVMSSCLTQKKKEKSLTKIKLGSWRFPHAAWRLTLDTYRRLIGCHISVSGWKITSAAPTDCT